MSAASRRADFIAAARRAAQAAVAEAAANPTPAEPPEHTDRGETRSGAFARIGQAIRSRRKPLLLAAAAIVLAIGMAGTRRKAPPRAPRKRAAKKAAGR